SQSPGELEHRPPVPIVEIGKRCLIALSSEFEEPGVAGLRFAHTPILQLSWEKLRCLPLGRLPQPDDIAVGVANPREAAHRNIDFGDPRFAAERLRLRDAFFNAIDEHVEDRVVERLVAERAEVALNTFLRPGLDHGRGTHGLRFPAKERGVELGGLRGIAGADFEVDDGIWHAEYSVTASVMGW